MASIKSCVVSLPKPDPIENDEIECRKIKASGAYPDTETLGDIINVFEETLTEDLTLDSLYVAFNDTLGVCILCDDVEVFRAYDNQIKAGLPIPLSCLKCKSGQTLKIVIAGPCEGDYFICLDARKV